jgi:hypothetical protein
VTVWGVLREAGHLYRLTFWRSLLIATPIFLVFDLPSAALDVLPDTGLTITLASIALALLTTYGDLLVEGALAFDVLHLHEGRPEPRIRDVVRRIRPFVVTIAVGAFVYAFFTSIGFLLLLVPGLLLMTRWCLIVPVIVIEKRGVAQAFRRSNRLVKGHSWRVFAVVGIMLVASSILEAFFDNLLAFLPEFIAHWLGTWPVSVLTAPYVAHALAVLYYRLADPERPVVADREAGPGD